MDFFDSDAPPNARLPAPRAGERNERAVRYRGVTSRLLARSNQSRVAGAMLKHQGHAEGKFVGTTRLQRRARFLPSRSRANNRRARRSSADIIVSRYGWRERDILNMTASRRHHYLNLING